MNYTKSTAILFALFFSLFKLSYAADISRNSTSLNGPTGLVNTPTAFTLKQGGGTIGIWEDFDQDYFDNLYFLYGVRNWLEVGIVADLPQQNNFSFLVKINSSSQDALFKGFPILAFGVYRSNSYLTASYKILPLTLNAGARLASDKKSVFLGGSLQIGPNLLLQIDSDGENYGIGIRGQLKRFQLSLMMDSHKNQALPDANFFWGMAFHF